MADAIGTTTTGAKALNQYYNDLFIETLYDKLAFNKGLAQEAKVPSGNGTSVFWVNIPRFSPAGAAPGTQGADATARSTNATRISAVLAEYQNYVRNSKLFMDTAVDGVKEQIIKNLAMDAAKTLDDVIMTKAVAGGTVLFAGAATHRSNLVEAHTATIDTVRKAVRLLELSSVPRFSDGYYVGLVHPDVVYDLQSDAKWSDYNKYKDSITSVIKGEMGMLWGVRFVSCPTIPVLLNSGSASTDVYRSLIFGEGFLGLSTLGELNMIVNEPGKASEMGSYNAYGYRFVAAAAVLSNQKGIRIESNASLA